MNIGKQTSSDDRSKMIHLRSDKGMSYTEIGRLTGFSRVTVANVCNPDRVLKRKILRDLPDNRAKRKILRDLPANKAKKSAYDKLRQSTPEYKINRKDWRNLPKNKKHKKEWRRSATGREWINNRHNERYKTDIQYKLRVLLRSRIHSAVDGSFKSGSAVHDLGCSIFELKKHLESLFLPGMTWSNWSFDGWHIDHIKPLSSFDLTSRNQLLEACNYTNLQPLWCKDNLAKGGKNLEELETFNSKELLTGVYT